VAHMQGAKSRQLVRNGRSQNLRGADAGKWKDIFAMVDELREK
jgi:hypothetical protein